MKGIKKVDLLTFPEVDYVYPDLPVYPAVYAWGTDRIDQYSLPLSGTYTTSFKGCGVDIYVVDSGIDANHIEFGLVNGVTRTVTNIYNHFGYVTRNIDRFGHGTHCAGIAGGNTIGVAPCANIYGLKIFDDYGNPGASSSVISALSFIKQSHLNKANAKSVVNLSFGGSCGRNTTCDGNPLNIKIAELSAVGIHFAIAANNNGKDACLEFPASAPEGIEYSFVIIKFFSI